MCCHCLLQDSPVPHAPSVPVIDLSRPDAQVAEELRTACIKYGFFTSAATLQRCLLFASMDCVSSTVPNNGSANAVANHGVEESLVEAIFEQNKQFFALPLEDKMIIAAKNVSHYRYAMHMQNSVHYLVNL